MTHLENIYSYILFTWFVICTIAYFDKLSGEYSLWLYMVFTEYNLYIKNWREAKLMFIFIWWGAVWTGFTMFVNVFLSAGWPGAENFLGWPPKKLYSKQKPRITFLSKEFISIIKIVACLRNLKCIFCGTYGTKIAKENILSGDISVPLNKGLFLKG